MAGLAQVGNGYALGNGSMGEYEAQIGATFGGFSADAVVRYAKDAVSLQTFSGSELPAGYYPGSILQATLADVAAVLVAARYKWDRTEIYGGYTYARLANPSDAFPNGFHTIARGIFVRPEKRTPPSTTLTRPLHTFWAGAKYDVWTNLSVAASFTYQLQNDFLPAPGICTGSGINISSPKCAGSELRHFPPDRLQALCPRRSLWRRNGLECVRGPRQRLFQAPEHRPDRGPAHQVLTGEPHVWRLL